MHYETDELLHIYQRSNRARKPYKNIMQDCRYMAADSGVDVWAGDGELDWLLILVIHPVARRPSPPTKRRRRRRATRAATLREWRSSSGGEAELLDSGGGGRSRAIGWGRRSRSAASTRQRRRKLRRPAAALTAGRTARVNWIVGFVSAVRLRI